MNEIRNIGGKLLRRNHPDYGPGDERNGVCWVRVRRERLHVIFSSGAGWDHVSVSHHSRCPTWQEMCAVRDLFWPADEWVVQFHPPQSEYVNFHPHCLHLWRPQQTAIPTPPAWMVGPRNGETIEDCLVLAEMEQP